MKFQNVKKLTIPQGEVAYIYQGNNLLWRRHSTPTSVLYNDGSMVFYADSAKIDTSKTIVGRYTGWDTDVYATTDAAVATTPWMGVATQIKSVSFVGATAPISTAYWFFGCTNLTSIDLTNLYTNKLVYMAAMFYNCSSLVTLDLSMLDTANLLNCNSMFAYCRNLTTIYVSDLWYTDKLVDSGYMFYECTKLKGDISFNSNYIDKTYATHTGGYLTYKGTVIMEFTVPTAVLYSNGDMIFYAEGESVETSRGILGKYTGWDTAAYYAATPSFHPPWLKDNMADHIRTVSFVGNVTVKELGSWFYGCSNLISVDMTNLDTSSVTNMVSMFLYCSSLTTIHWGGCNTSNVTDMGSMFKSCSSLATLDLSTFNTSNVTGMDSMFSSCSSLTTVNLSSFDTSNVTNMRRMFEHCSSIITLDLSSFDTSQVTSMVEMFSSCSSLATIYASDTWSVEAAANIYQCTDMFYMCVKLKGDIAYDHNYISSKYAKTSGGYLTYKANT